MAKTLKSKARPSRRERKQTAIKQKEETAKAQNAENIKENEQSKKLLVFDTSALNAVDFFEVIADYVILLEKKWITKKSLQLCLEQTYGNFSKNLSEMSYQM